MYASPQYVNQSFTSHPIFQAVYLSSYQICGDWSVSHGTRYMDYSFGTEILTLPWASVMFYLFDIKHCGCDDLNLMFWSKQQVLDLSWSKWFIYQEWCNFLLQNNSSGNVVIMSTMYSPLWLFHSHWLHLRPSKLPSLPFHITRIISWTPVIIESEFAEGLIKKILKRLKCGYAAGS